MTTSSGRKELPVIEDFLQISDPSVYTPIPDDWVVAVTDVRNSTEAIQRGLYKEVNLAGASSIMALLNIVKSFSLPFVFGGDGAIVCLPGDLASEAGKSLLATKQMAADVFSLDLRVGLVPVSDIRKAGVDLLLAWYRVSENFVEAVFSGGGVQYVEECLKNPALSRRYALEPSGEKLAADYSGLECRWKNVPSAHGEIVSLIVQATAESQAQRNAIYREIITTVREIYGSDVVSHPVQEELLRSSIAEKSLSGESGIRSYGKGRMYRFLYWFKIRFNVLLGDFLMATGYRSTNIEWAKYKPQLAANTDVKKFDDKFRQTLSGTVEQRKEMESYLEGRYRKSELVYGLHSAPTALITCLIFSYSGSHIHLVDSDKGGYAAAAQKMKERMKTL